MTDRPPPTPPAAPAKPVPPKATTGSPARDARLAQVGPMLVRAFRAQGLPGVWGLAFARQESDFVATGVNRSAADARRGYSWGLCQMSLQTAREELGYQGDGPGLLDPALNAKLAALYCRKLTERGHVSGLEDVAAMYNSGRRFDRAPESTRTVYVPRVLQFASDLVPFADSIPGDPE